MLVYESGSDRRGALHTELHEKSTAKFRKLTPWRRRSNTATHWYQEGKNSASGVGGQIRDNDGKCWIYPDQCRLMMRRERFETTTTARGQFLTIVSQANVRTCQKNLNTRSTCTVILTNSFQVATASTIVFLHHSLFSSHTYFFVRHLSSCLFVLFPLLLFQSMPRATGASFQAAARAERRVPYCQTHERKNSGWVGPTAISGA